MRVQQETTREYGNAIRSVSRKQTHKKKKIRYGRLSVAIMLMLLLVAGLTYVFIGMTHWMKTVLAPPPMAVIEQPAKLGMIQVTPEAKEEPARFMGQVRKVVYITFDDGPSQYTDQLLDILKQHEAKATFHDWTAVE